MKIIILAAGRGKRLAEKLGTLPKPLIEVHGIPLIEYVLRGAWRLRPSEIVIVGGYRFEQLNDYLKGRHQSIKLIHNHQVTRGNLNSLLKASQLLDEGFVLMNADHYYHPDVYDWILEGPRGIVAVCDFDRRLNADDMKVRLSAQRTLMAISKGLTTYDGGYVGLTKVAEDDVETYLQALYEVAASDNGECCVEDVLAHLTKKGTEVAICDISGARWFEIDTLEDLKVAHYMLAKEEIPLPIDFPSQITQRRRRV